MPRHTPGLEMKCPVCPGSDLVMSDRSGVEIDYCPTCRGIWLDRGELDKILERAHQESAPAPQQQQPQQPHYPPPPPHYDSRYYKKHYKRRKPWWMEIFD